MNVRKNKLMNPSLRRNPLYFREDRKEELFSEDAERATKPATMQEEAKTELVILEDGRSHCLICDKHYPDANLGRSHVMRTHLAPAVECKVCKKILKNPNSFTMHLGRQHNLKSVPNALKNYGKIVGDVACHEDYFRA